MKRKNYKKILEKRDSKIRMLKAALSITCDQMAICFARQIWDLERELNFMKADRDGWKQRALRKKR